MHEIVSASNQDNRPSDTRGGYPEMKRGKTRQVNTPLRPMEICEKALDADFLINLPVLKGHCQTVMTCALENCKGCPSTAKAVADALRSSD